MTDPTVHPAVPDPFAPGHPAAVKPATTATPATTSAVAADMMTEQEKAAAAGDPGAGVGPTSLPEDSPGPVETIEEQGIGPRTPYPEGNPPPPSDTDLANIETAKKDFAEQDMRRKERDEKAKARAEKAKADRERAEKAKADTKPAAKIEEPVR
jgi:hypothetical protein